MDSLTQAFAIDVASYAIMSNHYHLVVRVDTDKAQHWSWQEVVARWHQIYQGNMLSQRFMRGETLPTAERKILQSKAEVWRTRLSDISWFMSAMNEYIARLANAEEGVSGKFWQARFFSQALLDEQAILACSVYCDLNPIRAKMADTPEDSACTSIQQRIIAAEKGTVPSNLLRFQGPEIKEQEPGLPCSLQDYIELVEATGRIEGPTNAAPSLPVNHRSSNALKLIPSPGTRSPPPSKTVRETGSATRTESSKPASDSTSAGFARATKLPSSTPRSSRQATPA